jgi:bifunctional non-homologous end joining protein LigD
VSKKTLTTVAGHELTLSNLDKVLYPQAGFTKGQVIDYYTRIAPVMLPHLKDRSITLKRYPDGVEGPFFFEKNCPVYHPKWVQTAKVNYGEGKKTVEHCVISNAPALVWVANLASLELHVSLAKAKAIERPTCMAFDLDPGEGATILDCLRIGLHLRDMLAKLKLECFAKTSGGKGLHVYVPLNTPTTYEATKPLSRALAETLEKQFPDAITSNMSKALRHKKVFIDWSQNSLHKTTCAVYSLRARPRPTASTPVTWDEVSAALKKRDAERLVFEADAVLRRVEKHGDLFARVLTMKQKLPKLAN